MKSIVIASAVTLTLGLAACKPAGPPPDIIKTQREALQKAKEVNAVQQKSVEELQKAADEQTNATEGAQK